MEQKTLINLLLDCLHLDQDRVDSNLLTALTTAEWDALLSLAAKQRVQALFFNQLKKRNILDALPDDIQQSLINFYRFNVMSNMRYFGELHQIAKALKGASIPVIVLKGAYLAEVVYRNIALREMDDIALKKKFIRKWVFKHLKLHLIGKFLGKLFQQ